MTVCVRTRLKKDDFSIAVSTLIWSADGRAENEAAEGGAKKEVFEHQEGLVDYLRKITAERGAKPVHWCLDCGSSLAEAEVEYQDKVSAAIDVAFLAADQAAVALAGFFPKIQATKMLRI